MQRWEKERLASGLSTYNPYFEKKGQLKNKERLVLSHVNDGFRPLWLS
ncbi:hypothetical protein BH18THE2_BH18THE2_25090 [soil metagenome]